MSTMPWRSSIRVRPTMGFIEPCLPSPASRVPGGPDWVYELKHDGYRLMVRKSEDRVRIYSRRGADFTKRFPRIVEAMQRLKVRTALIDGEGVVYDDEGLPNFDFIHSKQFDDEVSLIAFDLLELDGEEIRKTPLLSRKARLAKLLSRVKEGIEYSEHIEGDGEDIFRAACRVGCEGIVAKRIDLPYESGRSKRWVKVKNPNSPAVRRAEDGTF